MPKMRSLELLVLDRLRQHSAKYPTVRSNRAPIFIVCRSLWLAHAPHRSRPTARFVSFAIDIISRGDQIPIAYDASSQTISRGFLHWR